MTTKTTITIRRPEGHEETMDVSAKFPVGISPERFAQIQKATKEAGRGWCLRYETTVKLDPELAARDLAAPAVKFGKSVAERRHDDLHNEGGEGYNPHR